MQCGSMYIIRFLAECKKEIQIKIKVYLSEISHFILSFYEEFSRKKLLKEIFETGLPKVIITKLPK